MSDESHMRALWLYSLETKKNVRLSDGTAQDFNATFDPKGRWLYFLSNRDYSLQFSAYEFNYLYTDATRIYAASLSADGPAFNPLKSDEVGKDDSGGKGKDEDKDKDKKGKDKSAGVAPLRIDADGFARRVVALAVPPGNYQGLAATDDAVFFLAGSGPGGQALKRYDLSEHKAEDVLAKGVTGYALSQDGKKLLARGDKQFALMDAKADRDFDKAKLNLDHLEARIDPRVEWQQEYVDAWPIL